MIDTEDIVEIEEIDDDRINRFKEDLNIKTVRKQIVDIIRGYDKTNLVRAIYLFGSRTKGTARDESDLDIVFFVDDEVACNFEYSRNLDKLNRAREEMASRLESLLGYEIDIIPGILKKGNPPINFAMTSGLELYATPEFQQEAFEFKLNKVLNNSWLY